MSRMKKKKDPGPEFHPEDVLIQKIATPDEAKIVERFANDPIVEDVFVPFSEGKTKIVSSTIIFNQFGDCYARNTEGRLVQLVESASGQIAEIFDDETEEDLQLDKIASFYVKETSMIPAFKAAIKKMIEVNQNQESNSSPFSVQFDKVEAEELYFGWPDPGTEIRNKNPFRNEMKKRRSKLLNKQSIEND